MNLYDCIVPNDCVACTPFKPLSTAQAAPGGGRAKSVSTPGGQGITLIPLTVLAGNSFIRPGDTVYVRAEDHAQPWARSVRVEGTEQDFIVVPTRSIVLVSRPQPEPPPPPES
jgi:hypothetical protein